ncbi:hypothetical protein [Mangrovibacterium marinum]|uniref:Uncharacterized protein n=1 Tax=Mangrovibacterium marinum TaxID=1639118 RepID=A0A2T5C3L9_9BACT|nr:hypothetical protein [Mangrovibacterium marinum]PTN09329.1 hypothetical protein C8N47_105170 [Mangrovibacterium marinum]
MRTLWIVCFLISIAWGTEAQEKYVFHADSLSFPIIEECPPNEYLSIDTRIKLAQFNQMYSREINMGAPNFQTSVEILKPDLYYSVQKLSKYFCKCLKKGIIKKDEAEIEFRSILDKCMLIVQKDTSPLEAELRATSNPSEIVGIFEKIEIQN